MVIFHIYVSLPEGTHSCHEHHELGKPVYIIFKLIGIGCNWNITLSHIYVLVGGLEHEFLFFHLLGIIVPTDFHIF